MTSTLPAPPPPPPAPTSFANSAAPSTRRFSPGLWIGIGIAVFGILGGLVFLGLHLPGHFDDIDSLHRATEDLPVSFRVEEAVRWPIVIEPDSESLARTTIEVIDVSSGESLPLGRSSNSFTYNWGSRSGRSVASVALTPGEYQLVVTGDAQFAIGPNPTGPFLAVALRTFLLAGSVTIGGVGLAVVSAVRDTRRRTRDATLPPPSPWSAGEWPADPGR